MFGPKGLIIAVLYFNFVFSICKCQTVLYSAVFFAGDPKFLGFDKTEKKYSIFKSNFASRYENLTIKAVYPFLHGRDFHHQTVKSNNKTELQTVVTHTKADSAFVYNVMEHNICPMFEKSLNEYKRNTKYVELLKNYWPVMENVSIAIGTRVNDIEVLAKVYAVARQNITKNETVAKKFSSVDMDNFREAACYGMSIPSDTPEVTRLIAGPLIKDLFIRLTEVNNLQTPVKQDLYRLDHTGLVRVLHALNIYNDDCPDDYAAMYLEVFEKNGDKARVPYVRLSYRSHMLGPDEQIMSITGCKMHCPLAKFLTLYEEIKPDDWLEVCFGKSVSDTLWRYALVTAINIGAIVVVVLYLCLIKKVLLRINENEVVLELGELSASQSGFTEQIQMQEIRS